MNPTSAATDVDLRIVAQALADTPIKEESARVRRASSIVAGVMTYFGMFWLIGGVVAQDQGVLFTSFVLLGLGIGFGARAVRVETFRRITRAMSIVGTAAVLTTAGLALLTAFLSGAAALAAFSSAIGLTTHGFWFSKSPVGDLIIALMLGLGALGMLALMSSASTPQVSAGKPRVRWVPRLQTCWVITQLVVIGVGAAFAVSLMQEAPTGEWRTEFDFRSTIVGVTVVLVGAVFTWHYRNRQLVTSERLHMIDLLSTVADDIRQGHPSVGVRLGELQRIAHPNAVARRSVATPPLASTEIITALDALYSAATGGAVPASLEKRAAQLPPAEAELFHRATELFAAAPQEFLAAGLPLLEQLRSQLLTGRAFR